MACIKGNVIGSNTADEIAMINEEWRNLIPPECNYHGAVFTFSDRTEYIFWVYPGKGRRYPALLSDGYGYGISDISLDDAVIKSVQQWEETKRAKCEHL